MASGKRQRDTTVSELHLLRHAKATTQGEGTDRDRPLEQRGRRAAQALAAWAAERRFSPVLVLCSPSLRTRQTLDIVAPAFARPPHILLEDAIYLATARQLVARLRQVPAGTASVMVVGHNPGLHELATLLSDVSDGPLMARLAAGLPTAALASYAVAVPWSALDRRLASFTGLVTPKELAKGLDHE
jgi:phosphohistidine phosphatase